MIELKRRMMAMLFGVFSLLVIVVIGFQNYQEYQSERMFLVEALNTIGQTANQIANPDQTGPYLPKDKNTAPDLDTLSLIYSNPVSIVTFESNVPLQVYASDLDHADVNSIVEKADWIVQHQHPGEDYVGNLYFDGTCWQFTSSRAVVLIDTIKIQKRLYRLLFGSVVLGGGFEIFVFLICKAVVKKMIAPIEATFQKQKQFIADASHELKTPVAVILANAEAMEQDRDFKWLANIEEEAGRMNGLITSLLDLTRSEQTELQLEPLNLSRLLEKQCLIMEAAMFEKHLELVEHIEGDVKVMGQASSLTQVIAILIDNAIEHSDGRVIASLCRHNKEVVMTISNTGMPIPPDQRERIFERFYRADSSRNRASGRYGLGLAIAKSIVEAHHGKIKVECKDGLTSFVVILRAA